MTSSAAALHLWRAVIDADAPCLVGPLATPTSDDIIDIGINVFARRHDHDADELPVV